MQPESEGHPLPPPELEIDGLGALHIRDHTMAVILDLERDLTPEDRASDDVIVRKFVARAASVRGPDEAVTRLSDAQVGSLSTGDLDRFALLCLECEDWSPPTEPESVDASATSRLAARLRQELKGEPIAWAGKDYLARAGFSDNTLRLMAESQKLSRQLKGMGILADIEAARQVTGGNSSRYLDEVVKAAKLPLGLADMIDKTCFDKIKLPPSIATALEQANATVSIDHLEVPVPPPVALRDSLIKATPNVGKQIGDKVDQVGEVLGVHLVKLSMATETIAQLHDTTNQALVSAIGDFKAQADKNERAARYALRIAAASMVVSAVIALFAYHQDGTNNEGNDKAQEAMLQLLSEQRSQLERISKANELQTKALLDLNGTHVLRASARPKRASLKLPPK